ncbi:MAG: Calx-beta domain-containing protein [Cyanobacteria bacterium J06638_22]
MRIESENYLSSTLPVSLFETTDTSGIAIRGEVGMELTYDLDSLAPGTYDLVARVVAPKQRSYSFDVEVLGQVYTFSFGSTAGNWNSYVDIVLPGISVSEVAQSMSVTMTSNRFNLNYLEFVPTGPAPEPTPGTVAFDNNSYTVSEDGTTASVTLVRTEGTSGAVSVDLALTDGTATAPGDYDNTLQTITFADGEASKTVLIPIAEDSSVEGDETVNLALANPTGGVTLGSQTTATLTIVDNDAPGAIAFDASSYTISEDGTTASVTLVRTGGTAGAVSVDLALTDGTATAPSDYDNTLQTVNFADGEASQTVLIPIVDDTVEESDETVNLALANPTGSATLGAQDSAVLTITDDDGSAPAGPVRLEAEAYSTSNNPVTTFTTTDASGVAIRGATGTVLTYDLTASAGTYDLVARVVAPKNGTYNFDATVNGQTYTISFGSTPGNWNDYIDVVIPDVSLVDGTQVLTLTMASNRFNLNYLDFVPTGPGPDPTPGAIAFDASSYTVSEDGTTASVTLVRTSGTAGAVSVEVGLTDGTATAPGDYDNTLQTVNFADGQASQTVLIPIVDDALAEGDETVNLALSNPIGGVTLGSQPTATLTIVDNDAPGAIAFDASSYTVSEDGTAASVTLVRTGGTAGAVSVDLALTDGTATAPGDYDNTLQTVNFADGQASQTVLIPIVDDTVEEGDETVNLTLANPTGDSTLGTQDSAILTIIDDDVSIPVGPIRVEAEAYSTSNNPVTTFTTTDASGVAIRGATGTVLTYDLTASAGTYDLVARVVAPKNGTYNFDATVNGQTYTISFGSTPGNWNNYIDVIIPDVSLVDGTQVLTLTMASNRFNLNYLDFVPTGPGPDPTTGAVAFDASSYTVSEDGTTASITLVRTGGTAGSVSVEVGLTDGTATAPDDYDSTPQTITFADGEASQTVFIPIVDDGLVEGDETVNLSLANPTGGVTLGSQTAATLTIVDNDQTPSPDPIRIMPLGDSITHGWNTFPGGYRDRLENLLTENDIAFDFVGSATPNGPSSLSDRNHQGHPGWRIDEIAASADAWIQAANPDVIQLLIGTNDVLQEFDLANAPARLSALIDQITAAAPDAHVVVATIPPHERNFFNNLVLDYNATIEGIVDDKVAQGKNVSFVDMYSELTVADLGDRVHPNQTGYEKIAGVWFDELLNLAGDFGTYDALNDDYYVNANIIASDSYSTTVRANLHNDSAVARSDLSFRYFVDLSELFDAGYSTNDVLIGEINGPLVSDLNVWDAAEDIYYVEVDFSGTAIAPSNFASVEFSLGVSSSLPTSAWDTANDWSTQSLTGDVMTSRHLPVYDGTMDRLSGVVPVY